jgi:hypothetical protein
VRALIILMPAGDLAEAENRMVGLRSERLTRPLCSTEDLVNREPASRSRKGITMIRTLKTLSLAVLVATALAAAIATAAQAAAFTGEGGKNAIITLEQTLTNQFEVETGIIKCSTAKITATTVVNGTTTVTVHPEYSGCKCFGVSCTVTTTGCNYTFHLQAGGASETDIGCIAGSAIVATPVNDVLKCTVTIGSQSGLAGISYSNGSKDIVQSINVSKVSYAETGVNCAVPGGHANGNYTGTNTITGFEDVSGSEGSSMGVSVDF